MKCRDCYTYISLIYIYIYILFRLTILCLRHNWLNAAQWQRNGSYVILHSVIYWNILNKPKCSEIWGSLLEGRVKGRVGVEGTGKSFLQQRSLCSFLVNGWFTCSTSRDSNSSPPSSLFSFLKLNGFPKSTEFSIPDSAPVARTFMAAVSFALGSDGRKKKKKKRHRGSRP